VSREEVFILTIPGFFRLIDMVSFYFEWRGLKMIKMKWIALVTLACSVLLPVNQAFAWYGSAEYATIQDVHLTDTYWWARSMGFSDIEAKNISQYDDGVDVGARFLDKSWHLDRRAFTGDTIDTRQKNADAEMALAKYYISLVPGFPLLESPVLQETGT
jgi:hypothetical protein